MTTEVDFLEKVARKLYDNHGTAMEKQVIVLPSRRAGLYLSRYLSRLSPRPQWAPMMVTVTELFYSFTDLKPAGNEMLIFELYQIYSKNVSEPMQFDDFWSWGEVIISDFNDIDLYLADAAKLYSNISDLKEIDDKFGGLQDEQIEIIRKFWISFNPGSADSEARNRFLSVWKILGPLYADFKTALQKKGYAGDGMLCRDVSEKAAAGMLEVPDDLMWHITGLNALNECEKNLFRHLRSRGQARFYWDDDHAFMSDPEHKASLFIRENIRLFGNELSGTRDSIMPCAAGRWIIIDAPSDTAQAKMLPEIINEAGISDASDLTDTAIILADEKLLMPVLTSLPAEIEEVNVTMGHPFRLTPLYSFVRQLFVLARSARRSMTKLSFRTEDVLALLRHQYFRLLSAGEGDKLVTEMISGNMVRVDMEYLSARISTIMLFGIPDDGAAFPDYLLHILQMLEEKTFKAPVDNREMSIDREYIRLAMAETGKLMNLIRDTRLQLKVDTCIRLIDRVFKRLIVPFSGEPLKGIQVMGVLETRALEFRNIIFLSLNEGIFPQQSYDNTFIPYNIRRAFGLPTINEHESIYSYHFFRLLRKPQHGWFLYNSTSQGLASGEMSRYLIQMRYDPFYQPLFRTLHITVGRSKIMPETLLRDRKHSRLLLERYTATNERVNYLSPSAVNTWMTCRMKFYYRYICGIPEEEKLEKDIDQRRFGNILHEVMKKLYEPLLNEKDLPEKIKSLSANVSKIRNTIIETASAEMKWSVETLLAGKGVIILDVLERYIKEIMDFDTTIDRLSLLRLENKISRVFTVNTASGPVNISIGGVVDRIDMAGNVMRVVDYKTGTPKNEKVSIDDLFDEQKKRRNDAMLQTLLYCDVLSAQNNGEIIMPAIYWVQQISSSEFSPSSNLTEFSTKDPDIKTWAEVMGRFNTDLTATLQTIFSDEENFTMTEFDQRCTYCPYIRLCRR